MATFACDNPFCIMAFIRWKISRQGLRRAYLVHSYRNEDGLPRHKTLAYLGAEGELTPERMNQLREKHKELNIAWAKVRTMGKPVPRRVIQTLSDVELLRDLKALRRDKGLSIKAMAQALADSGAPSWNTGWGTARLDAHRYKRFEDAAAEDPTQRFFAGTAPDFVPYLRKVLA